MNKLTSFVKNILLTIDQAGNVLLLGDADETISARSYRKGTLEGNTRWKLFEKAINLLFWFESSHTEKAYLAEQKRCHMPSRYREDNSCDIIDTKEPK